MPKDDLIKQIRKLVKRDSQKYLPYFWDYHMLPMIHYSMVLAKKIRADKEIVEISALLHDLTWLRGDKSDNHNISASEEASKILGRFDYPKDRIKTIQHCILAHRGDEGDPKRETKEAECIASADVMAHLDSIPALLYFCFVTSDLSIEQSTKWLIKKIERGWNKLIPEARSMSKEKYKSAKLLLTSMQEWFPQE